MLPSREQIAETYARVQRELASSFKIPRNFTLEDALVVGLLCGQHTHGQLDDLNHYCAQVQDVIVSRIGVSEQAQPQQDDPSSQFNKILTGDQSNSEKNDSLSRQYLKEETFASYSNAREGARSAQKPREDVYIGLQKESTGDRHSQLQNTRNFNFLGSQAQKTNQNDEEFDMSCSPTSPQQQSMDSATRAMITALQEDDLREERARRMESEIATECEICTAPLYDEGLELTPLDGCTHVYHEDCMRQYLKASLESDRLTIKCPEEGCQNELVLDSYQHLIEKERFDRYKQLLFQNFIDLNSDEYSWCPTAGCRNVFILEGNQTRFFCFMCKKDYCLACRVEFHKGQTCKEFIISNKRDENDEKFENFVKGAKFKQCTACKFFVEKNQGCDHMRCRCGYEFCYKCGGKFMQCECQRKALEEQRQRAEQQRLRLEEQRQRALARQAASAARLAAKQAAAAARLAARSSNKKKVQQLQQQNQEEEHEEGDEEGEEGEGEEEDDDDGTVQQILTTHTRRQATNKQIEEERRRAQEAQARQRRMQARAQKVQQRAQNARNKRK